MSSPSVVPSSQLAAKRQVKGIRSYQRRIAALTALVKDMQWVQPMYNGGKSCAGCGQMIYHGCAKDCPTAKVTGHRGHPESEAVR